MSVPLIVRVSFVRFEIASMFCAFADAPWNASTSGCGLLLSKVYARVCTSAQRLLGSVRL
jgi:hypothetical protein